ncbi:MULTISPECIES: class I SAM-dependent RNA methyltransferase [unclassified Micromonospora]|uniref:class I SAM-dependent RNA methyltransferase n=1 Tax=unclassified Micromonospora TaxID=2617518 RepID=UPI001B378795|nr:MULTISPECIES: TRAM domain-containing protein [unclassified Micromonospora]MBQ1042152.1 class I SAM-dependent RNA methyltransferase [Micromonospora sp. C72]MBQ1056312.1 class I SAM-dependent RNA methyltransferase [Micromonospora sp. C32]
MSAAAHPGPASAQRPGLEEAERVELTVDAVAPGGHCVARVGGQVVFVRHALPGERVIAEVTELHRGFARADAVEILDASPDRVTPPCPYARPGRCGGCDLQHVAPAAQLDWKLAVVREQLTRLGRLTTEQIDALGVRVEALPGGPLGWRSRVRYAVDAAGRAGLLKHRSHEVVPIDRCLIAHPAIQELPVLPPTGTRWPDADAVETVASTGGDVAVVAYTEGVATAVSGPQRVRETAAGRSFTLPASGFWQVHPAAADALTGAVLDLLDPRPGETAWDLYGGAGLFAAALAGRVGGARVTLVESAPDGVAAARENLADLRGVEVVAARVETALARRRVTGPVDLVVLDPPRSGAGAPVVRDVVAAGPRAVAYVACDPAAFARDVRTFTDAGWRLAELRGYDLFPMTQHVELVGLFLPPR